jgi:hypothetical protein
MRLAAGACKRLADLLLQGDTKHHTGCHTACYVVVQSCGVHCMTATEKRKKTKRDAFQYMHGAAAAAAAALHLQ